MRARCRVLCVGGLLALVACGGDATSPTGGTVVVRVRHYRADTIAAAAAVEVYGMNDAGQIAGVLRRTDGERRAFRWTAGKFDTLPSTVAPSAPNISGATGVYGIDNASTVLGILNDRAVIWRVGATVPESLAVPPQYPTFNPHISPNGTIYSADSAGNHYVLRPTRTDTLRFAQRILVQGINDHGDLFGLRADYAPYYPAAIEYADGRSATISIGGRGRVFPVAMNSAGVFIGSGEVANAPGDGFTYHAFSYGGSSTDLTKVYGDSLESVSAINDEGQILATIHLQPVLLSGGATITRVVTVDPSLTPLPYLGQWMANSGKVVAFARCGDAVVRAVLLTPID